MSHAIPAWQAALEAETPPPSLRRIVRASLAIITIAFGGFFLWGFTAHLDVAAPATGVVIVESKRKTVTVLDPGILAELKVREGDRVTAGELLLRLDDTQVRSQAGSLEAQYWTARVRAARLEAEQSDARAVTFPSDIEAAAARDPAVAERVATERRVMSDRWAAYDDVTAAQTRKIAQLGEQVTALRAQEEATRQRLAFTARELAGIQELVTKGYAPRAKLYDLQRADAELKGDIGEIVARIGAAEQAAAQSEIEMASTKSQRQQEISHDLQEAQSVSADLAERLRGARDLLAKRNVLAPEAGTVANIRAFTPGSAIGAGQPILDLVPDDERMVIEAKVRPDDIAQVRAGQRVNVRLTAYKTRQVPVLGGNLVYVSADRQEDSQGNSFFTVRAELDSSALADLPEVKLEPGMPAEVLIIGGERRAIDYLISPITDSMHRAMRER